jgi:hypothetical protein
MKDTTNTQMSASYIDLHIEIDRWGRGELKTKHYDKCDDFTFTKFNFPFISSYIPTAPAYEI